MKKVKQSQRAYDATNYPCTFNLLNTNHVCDTENVMVVVPFEDDEGMYTAKVHWLDNLITEASKEAQQWAGQEFPDLIWFEKMLPDLWLLFSMLEWVTHVYIFNEELGELESVHDLIANAMQEVVDNYLYAKNA